MRAFVLTDAGDMEFPVTAYLRPVSADKAAHFADKEARMFHVSFDAADVTHGTGSRVVLDRCTILEEIPVRSLAIRRAERRQPGTERQPLAIPRRWMNA